MQARSYRPDIARFLSPDRYEAASGDVALQSDPLTNNRYAFGSGNPVDNIEWDGHDPHAIETGCKGDPNCGDRVGLASAAQSGPVAHRRAKRELRAFKPVQAVARSQEASAKAGKIIPYKTATDDGYFFVNPNTCTASRDCFLRSADRAGKWDQKPGGGIVRTRAELAGANNAHTYNPGRVIRQMAGNKLKYRGAIRDAYLGYERADPSASTARIAETFDPGPPGPDNAIGIDDLTSPVIGFGADVASRAGRIADAYGGSLAGTARGIPGSGLAIGAVNDAWGSNGVMEAVTRTTVGFAVVGVTAVAFGGTCSIGTLGTGLVTGGCAVGGAVVGAGANQIVAQPLLDRVFDDRR